MGGRVGAFSRSNWGHVGTNSEAKHQQRVLFQRPFACVCIECVVLFKHARVHYLRVRL